MVIKHSNRVLFEALEPARHKMFFLVKVCKWMNDTQKNIERNFWKKS